MSEKVAIVGASDKPERYAFKAFMLLQEYGHRVFPVSPNLKTLRDQPVVSSLSALPESVDTITIYVRPEISTVMRQEIIQAHPRRVIFNPGSENPELQKSLREAGIAVEEACTLVLLKTNQFNMDGRR